MEKNKLRTLLLTLIFCTSFSFAQEQDFSSLVQGLESYRNGDWQSATMFLRKAVTSPENCSAEVFFMLVMSQMYSENYGTAVNDCDRFIEDYNNSPLLPCVEYQKGRALHFLGQNDSAVILLSDFCHQYPDDVMYSSALYWIAECFYEDYNFDSARAIYEKIVAEYPDCSKKDDAQFKLDLIAQRDREQKLLYLLKMTGEEFLSSRENYEKQLREFQSEDLTSLRRQLDAANSRIKELELQKETLAEIKQQTPVESDKASVKTPVLNEDILTLKEKARQIQSIMDQKYSGK